jgi:membrane protease subunit HflK
MSNVTEQTRARADLSPASVDGGRHDPATYGRGATSALLGLAVQAVAAPALVILALYTGSAALIGAAHVAVGGLGVWVIIALVYQQMRLARLEALESEQLARRAGTEESLFAQSPEDLMVAQRRLTGLLRLGLPLVGLLTGLYLVGGGAWLLWRVPVEPLAQINVMDALARAPYNPLLAATITGALFFVVLVSSRYLAGLARTQPWGLLRAGANHLMGAGALAGAAAVLLALANTGLPVPLAILGWAAPIFAIVIGSEILLTVLLDLYRPRRRGELPQPAFESRLLGLLTSPENVARTLNDAINYQFGFEITRSWFWQLLARAALPLAGGAVAVLLALSCVVIVPTGHQAVVLRFGEVTGEALEPGFHLKAPWPVSVAALHDVERVRQIHLWSPEGDEDGMRLWTRDHTPQAEPNLVLVAREPYRARAGSAQVPNGLARLEVVVQYRIADLGRYVRSAADPEAMLNTWTESEAARTALRFELDAVLGEARSAAGAQLRRGLQARAERLGVEVLDASFVNAQPPEALGVSASWHNVVRARYARDARLQEARRRSTQTLVEAVGSRTVARQVVEQLAEIARLTRDGTPAEALSEREQAVEQALREADGEAARILAEARAERWERENSVRGAAERFGGRLAAYEANPRVYGMRLYLEALAEGLDGARKLLIGSKQQDLNLRLDLKQQQDNLQNILGAQE